MLQVTPAAAEQIAETRRRQGVPDSFGVRIFGERQSGGDMNLSVVFAEVPAEDDAVSLQGDTRVFLAPDVAEPLAAAALDVEITPEGPQLVLTEQESGPDI